MEFVNLGTSADDGTGDNGRDAFAKVNRNAIEMMQYVGYAGREYWAQMGDSMAGNASSSNGASVLAQVRMLHHDFNAIVDLQGYYNPDTEVPYPAGQRGRNFGKGGTTVAHMRAVQLPFILKAIDDNEFQFSTVFMSVLQNDAMRTLAIAKQLVGDVLFVVDALLAKGKKVFMLGLWPKTGIVTGSYGKHYCERALSMAAESRPGFLFIPFLEHLKTGDPTQEANEQIAYQAGMSGDRVHALDPAARKLAPVVAAHLRKIVPEYKPPAFDAVPFLRDQNPLGNIFGAPGRFGGSGGRIIDLSKPDDDASRVTISPNVPAGVEVQYDTTKGIALTPRLIDDIYEPFEIELDGIPTAEQLIYFAVLTSAVSYNPGGPVEMWGQVRLIEWEGVSGLGSGAVSFPTPDGVGIGSSGGLSRIVPQPRNEVVTLHSMAPAFYRNEFGSAAKIGVGAHTVAGIPIKGRIRFRRLGMFASSIG